MLAIDDVHSTGRPPTNLPPFSPLTPRPLPSKKKGGRSAQWRSSDLIKYERKYIKFPVSWLRKADGLNIAIRSNENE